MKNFLFAGLLVFCVTPAFAQNLPRIAVFDFGFENTSLSATTPAELERLHRLDQQLTQALRTRFLPIDMAPVRARSDRISSIRGCNGCELDLARELGAEQVAFGWVQKVSNLILNVNLVVEDIATGRRLRAESVDIRGNTDESWNRGLRYLLDERMFRE
jgi:hypothetical protein